MLKIFIYIFFCLFLSSHVYSQAGNYDVWKENFDRGKQLLESDKPKDALTYLEKASQEADYLFATDDKEYGDTYFKLGLAHKNVKNYQEALIFYEKAIDNSIVRDDDKTYIERLIAKASVYRFSLDYDSSIETYNKSLQIIEKSFGKDDPDYSTTLIGLTTVYKLAGHYESAFATINEALLLIEQNLGRNDPDYSNAVSILAHIYIERGKTGDYEIAIALQEQQLKKIDDDDKDTASYAQSIYALSMLYHKVGEYQKELSLLTELTGILGKSYEVKHPSINNQIGQAYECLGDYEKALSYTLRSVNKTNENDEGYGTRIQNLAYIYTEMGEFEKALTAYDKALLAMEKSIGKDHKDYGKLLNNIGKLQFRLGNYEKAKQLFEDALTNFLKNFDENNEQYGYQLNDYARTLLRLGQNDEAIRLMKYNLEIAEKNSETDTEAYFKKQHDLATSFNYIGNFNDALPLLQNATKNVELILGTNHTDYGKMIKTLGDSYVGLGNLEMGYPLMKKANEVNYSDLEKIFQFRSEKEKKSFLSLLVRSFEDFQSIPMTHSLSSDIWNEMNLNNQLALKGLLLNNSKNVLTELASINDTLIDNSINDYKGLKRKLSMVMSTPAREREIDADSLDEIINYKEANLVKLHSTKFSGNASFNRDWKLAQSQLPKKSIGIEFSHFNLTINGKPTDSTIYVAYIYKPESKNPKVVRLFEERQLRDLLKGTSPNSLYSSNGLYNLVWKPLTEHIKKSKTIYFSPSGLLNQIQFAAIRKPNKSIFGKEFNLVQLSSTWILTEHTTNPNADDILFIGGIDYDYNVNGSNNNDSIQNSIIDNKSLKNTKAPKFRGESWTYLPGTLTEIKNLESLFKLNDLSSQTLTGKEATETNFKKLNGQSPAILHIATHGYFYKNLQMDSSQAYNLSTEDHYRLAEDPLLRSGLILAGANYTWKNGSKPNEEDGILTAMEISNMDLSTTKMVVLSACKTGLGDIDGSEGVYGLQRAFKMAGVDIIVMSLWQVPDAETAEFMNLFYGNWMKGNQVRKAFSQAQRTMQKKYADEPLKWAAFVLFE